MIVWPIGLWQHIIYDKHTAVPKHTEGVIESNILAGIHAIKQPTCTQAGSCAEFKYACVCLTRNQAPYQFARCQIRWHAKPN
jgi:hypothetical protein